MNNNRNNRRRGRGNRNQGGGNQLNRIDSRARGNAPQLLDKYKKLAQDAQHNGDRVQAEYYLQFADHYLRVISDNKARQDEARAKRNEERGSAGGDTDEVEGNETRRRNTRRPRRDDQVNDQHSEGERGDEGGAPDENAGADAEEQPKRRVRKPRGEGRSTARSAKKAANGKASNDSKTDEIDASVLPPAIGGDDDSDDNLEQVN